jgi:iron complex transport system ATP-binding protein
MIKLLTGNSIHYQFKNGSPILNQLSLEVHAGKLIGLLGPNGVGKTTLLKVLAGMLPLKNPSVLQWMEREVNGSTNPMNAQKVFYIGSHLEISFPLTVEQVLEIGLRAFQKNLSEQDRNRIENALEWSDLIELRDQVFQNLSGGQKQRVLLARALALRPQVLLLDETLSKMDLHFQLKMIQNLLISIQTQKIYSAVLVDHDINFLSEWCDELWLFAEGKIIASGKPVEVLNEKNLERLYPGLRIHLTPHPTTGGNIISIRRTKL